MEIKINPSIFRAYDIRGIYPNDLNEEAAWRIAKAFGELYPQAKKIVVARDPRISSPSLAKAVKESLVEVGKEVADINIAPDPLFYFSIFHYHFDGGIMVSGSHNPKEHNGLTLHVKKPGKEISEDVIGKDLEKIKELALENKRPKTSPQKGKITVFNPSQDYIDYVTGKVNLKRPLKIIIDSGNGATGFLPEKVFQKLGCQVKTLYGDFDGTFPHHLPDPYEEKNLKDAREEVLNQKADIGFAYDCDGDRIGVLDNRGRVVSGDFCLLMLARHVLQNKRGPIVHDMRVSKALLDEMKKQGVKTYFSVSHHNAVINKITETDAVFGGEITLHFLFPLDYYLCDDAVFASLKLAEIASNQKDLAEYVDSLPRYYASPEVFIDTTDEAKFKIIENLQNYLRENNYNFIDIDGARINFPNGWALARAANTSPYIKCRFEGDTEEDLIKIEKKALEIFEKVGILITKEVRQELAL
jgi:phosphomannomutase/phosphoglucomutase